MINDVAASGDEPGAAILMSVFFIKHGFIAFFNFANARKT